MIANDIINCDNENKTTPTHQLFPSSSHLTQMGRKSNCNEHKSSNNLNNNFHITMNEKDLIELKPSKNFPKLNDTIRIKIVAKMHSFYSRHNLDLLCTTTINPVTALFGGKLIINKLNNNFLSY